MKNFISELEVAIDTQPNQNKLEITSDLNSLPAHIKANIFYAYENQNPIIQVWGSILNASFTQKRLTALWSKRIINNLVKSDTRMPGLNGVNTKLYKNLVHELAKNKIIKVIRSPDANRAAVIEIVQGSVVDSFFEVFGADCAHQKKTECAQYYDSYFTPKTEGLANESHQKSHQKSHHESHQKSRVSVNGIDPVTDNVSDIYIDNDKKEQKSNINTFFNKILEQEDWLSNFQDTDLYLLYYNNPANYKFKKVQPGDPDFFTTSSFPSEKAMEIIDGAKKEFISKIRKFYIEITGDYKNKPIGEIVGRAYSTAKEYGNVNLEPILKKIVDSWFVDKIERMKFPYYAQIELHQAQVAEAYPTTLKLWQENVDKYMYGKKFYSEDDIDNSALDAIINGKITGPELVFSEDCKTTNNFRLIASNMEDT